MTNKEAIKYLIQPFATSTRSYNEYLKQREAYELAIKALETLDTCTYFKQDACGKCMYYDWQTEMRKDYCGNDTPNHMEEDAKQASIPYTYNAPQHDWKCGYPDNTRGKEE